MSSTTLLQTSDEPNAESAVYEGPHIETFADITPTLKQLSRLTAWKSMAAILFDWGFIVGSFVLASSVGHPAVWIAAAIVIATRQHALLILMHDASHFRLLQSHKANDRLSNWLLAWPLFVTTEGYRQNHLAHHRHLNTDEDPDWVRKRGKPAWNFPKTRIGLAWLLFKELLGGGFLEAIRAITDLSGRQRVAAKSHLPKWERPAFYLLAISLITYFGLWWIVLALWILPAFTLLTVILRIRSIAEHFGVEHEHELNSSRNTNPYWWERFLLAPHNSAAHLDHHLFPSVPFYNLPKLHECLAQNPRYATCAHQSDSLFGTNPTSFFSEVTQAETARAHHE